MPSRHENQAYQHDHQTNYYIKKNHFNSALAQGDERIEHQSIEGQALAKRTFAGAKCPLRRDADLVR
jgi:hypothetical protein